MISFVKALFLRNKDGGPGPEAGLKGTPVRERWKTYSAELGYACQYVYRGYREVSEPAAHEFVFEVRNGPESRPVGVRVASAAVGRVSTKIERALTEQEVYAIAKMALFRGFDEAGGEVADVLMPMEEDMLEILARLGQI